MMVVRLAELFSCYIILKAIWELWLNQKTIIGETGVYSSIVHAYQHMAALVGIICYNIFDLFSYVYFEDLVAYSDGDYTVFFFNILFMNIVWLIIIDHFKQERIGVVKSINFMDIFKF